MQILQLDPAGSPKLFQSRILVDQGIRVYVIRAGRGILFSVAMVPSFLGLAAADGPRPHILPSSDRLRLTYLSVLRSHSSHACQAGGPPVIFICCNTVWNQSPEQLSHCDRQRCRLGFPDLRKTKMFKKLKKIHNRNIQTFPSRKSVQKQ